MTTQEATGWASPSPRWAAAARVAALIQVNFGLITREPGAVVSRLVQPIVLITLMRPLYVAALAKDGPQAGTSQVVTGMLVMFSLLALSLSAMAQTQSTTTTTSQDNTMAPQTQSTTTTSSQDPQAAPQATTQTTDTTTKYNKHHKVKQTDTTTSTTTPSTVPVQKETTSTTTTVAPAQQ